MTDPHLWINSIGTVITGATALAALRYAMKAGQRDDKFDVVKHEREMAVMGERVSTMWGAFVSSGVQKGLAKGLLRMESPVQIEDESMSLLEEIKADLQAFRRDECPDCCEQELALKIAAKFKEQIIRIVPNIQFELAVVIATAVAKGTQTLTEILDEFKIPLSE